MSTDGDESRNASSGTRLWPPASSLASSPCSASRLTAWPRLSGRTYSNGAGFTGRRLLAQSRASGWWRRGRGSGARPRRPLLVLARLLPQISEERVQVDLVHAGRRDLQRKVRLARRVDPHLGDQVRSTRGIVGRRVEGRPPRVGDHERVLMEAYALRDRVPDVGVARDVDVLVDHHH